MGKLCLNDVVYGGGEEDEHVELTKTEYDALPDNK